VSKRLVVVGAGPSGLAAALGGVRRGLDVTVLERGEVGASLRRWGPTRFFSPLAMNLMPGTEDLLGPDLPPSEALLTGEEFASQVLAPLAASPLLSGKVQTNHRVVAIGRAGMTRTDYAGHPLRGERPFRLLVEARGAERWIEADAVLDATGTYGQPLATGPGGLPAPGERAHEGRIIRALGALHTRRAQLAGKRILLVGHGHSAAHAIRMLEGLAHEAPETRVIWATRVLQLRPCVAVASDPLPERRDIVSHANDLAQRPPPWLRVERRVAVQAFASTEEGALQVSLGGDREVIVDGVVSLTGYRPDLSFLSELALEIAPSTEGAARLTRALASVTDCLSVPAVAPADLDSGEPGFHLIGAKSYGRSRTFLLQTGYAHIATILDAIARTER
jgi:thioredoxin reductase